MKATAPAVFTECVPLANRSRLDAHACYLQLAIEWDDSGRTRNRLLYGSDIAEAKGGDKFQLNVIDV